MSVITKKPVKVAPVTIFTATKAEAVALSACDKNSAALVSGPGTLAFHKLIAQHGVGEIAVLYCPEEYRGAWVRPAGGVVRVAS